jgi:hypothetical protein
LKRLASALPIALALAWPASAQQEAQPPSPAQPGEASGGWAAATVIEPESLEEVRAAAVTNADGFTLAVARQPGGERVIGILRLPAADPDFLDEGRPLEIQLDDGRRLEAARLGGSLKSVSFFLWDGVGEPALGPLRDLMEASRRIVIEYPLAGGGHKQAAFVATGVKAAVAAVLGVAEEVSAEARALALARQEAVEGCLAEAKSKDRDRCLERLAGCADAATAEALHGCLASSKSSSKK